MEFYSCTTNRPVDIQPVLGPWIQASKVPMNTTLTTNFTKSTNEASTRGTSASKWTQLKLTSKNKSPSIGQSGEDRSHDAIMHSKYTPLVGATSKQANDSHLMDIVDVKGTTVKEK